MSTEPYRTDFLNRIIELNWTYSNYRSSITEPNRTVIKLYRKNILISSISNMIRCLFELFDVCSSCSMCVRLVGWVFDDCWTPFHWFSEFIYVSCVSDGAVETVSFFISFSFFQEDDKSALLPSLNFRVKTANCSKSFQHCLRLQKRRIHKFANSRR